MPPVDLQSSNMIGIVPIQTYGPRGDILSSRRLNEIADVEWKAKRYLQDPDEFSNTSDSKQLRTLRETCTLRFHHLVIWTVLVLMTIGLYKEYFDLTVNNDDENDNSSMVLETNKRMLKRGIIDGGSGANTTQPVRHERNLGTGAPVSNLESPTLEDTLTDLKQTATDLSSLVLSLTKPSSYSSPPDTLLLERENVTKTIPKSSSKYAVDTSRVQTYFETGEIGDLEERNPESTFMPNATQTNASNSLKTEYTDSFLQQKESPGNRLDRTQPRVDNALGKDGTSLLSTSGIPGGDFVTISRRQTSATTVSSTGRASNITSHQTLAGDKTPSTTTNVPPGNDQFSTVWSESPRSSMGAITSSDTVYGRPRDTHMMSITSPQQRVLRSMASLE